MPYMGQMQALTDKTVLATATSVGIVTHACSDMTRTDLSTPTATEVCHNILLFFYI